MHPYAFGTSHSSPRARTLSTTRSKTPLKFLINQGRTSDFAPVACWSHAMHASRMPKMLQVRNVPDRVHRTLKERAARRGTTLSTYVLEELERLASQPALDDWL